MQPDAPFPGRPPRITPFNNNPLYFITFNTHHRMKVLADERIHRQLITFCRKAEARGASIGRYVIMPDHIHLFLRSHESLRLGTTIRLLKRSLSSVIDSPLPHWQPGFFDHLLRGSESYAEKWHYVAENPVRAGLVARAEDWVFQGEIVLLDI